MSTGIDAGVVLGLAGKMSQVFTRPGTYLSFPLAPLGIEGSRLEAMINDPLSDDGQAALAEFSLTVNEIPNGSIWQGDGGPLWDVYGDLLTDVELADPSRTPEEEADYQRAYDLLYQTEPDGTVTPTSTVVDYEEARDAYLAAALEYNNRKNQAELSGDPEVQQQWAEDEPELRQSVEEAEQDWATSGHRAEVDDARRLVRELGSRSPETTWAGYRKLFDPDLPEIYFRTSGDGTTYLPTAYLPADVIDVAWPTITVTNDDLEALASSAPEELRSRLVGGSGDTEVEDVSFEYSYLTVHRPWFTPDPFNSRAWRFYEPDRVLSDGESPPSGECTAYVTGLVLARNITVRQKARPQARAAPALNLAFLPTTRQLAVNPVALRTAIPPARPAASRATVRDRRTGRPRVRDHRTGNSGTRNRRTRDHRTRDARVRDHRTRDARVRDHRTGTTREGTLADRLLPQIRAAETVRSRRKVTRVPARRGTRTPTESTTTTSTDPGEIYVLAFVCRLLPKSPDPDPTLFGSPDGRIKQEPGTLVAVQGAISRDQPSREGGVVATLEEGRSYETVGYTDDGENVAGSARWYRLQDGAGWVHSSGGTYTQN